MHLEGKLEAVLFYKAEPVSKKELGSFLGAGEGEVEETLTSLQHKLSDRGIRLIMTDTDARLVTAPELDHMIEALRKEDLNRSIGKAGAETLAIILYRGPVTRADIDFIRGVNSTFILRNLLVRGLIERTPYTKDKRQFQYSVTTDLLAHLGITRKEDIPEYVHILDELDVYEKEHRT